MGTMQRALLTGHTGLINSAAFLQDGQQIVSGLGDSMIHMQDTVEAAIDMATQVDFTDQSKINSEGWICCPRDELLVYIPYIHRTSLYCPSNIWILGAHPTSLDLSSFVHGQDWAACFNSET